MSEATRLRLSTFAASLVLGLAIGVAGHPKVAAAEAPPPSVPDPLFDADAEPPGFPDPFEGVNRITFEFNRKVDRWVFDPITRAYRFVVPAPARRAVRRAFVNLDAPVTFVNDILQLEPRDAAVTLARFVVNTTVGIGGLFDVAGDYADLAGHESDFGQTLALAGMPSGPYLVIPVLGPNSARDTTGYVVDFLFRPTTYLLTPGGTVVLSGFVNPSGSGFLFTTIFEGSTELAEGFATREASGEALHALEASSVDYYAALKNAYYQNRTALIWRRGPDHGPLARAKWVLAALSLGPSGGEVRDLAADAGHERVEAAALEH
jgi:phospholipid-binding lipoprotein MlaA